MSKKCTIFANGNGNETNNKFRKIFEKHLKNFSNMTQDFNNVRHLADYFLRLADRFNNEVSAYLSGSKRTHDSQAYLRVKMAYKNFINAYNAYYEESNDDCIDYELAYSVL